ncbi:DUF1289 domain-containing protein [Glacieibacterium sp.]|uniref:DUF1289 domain-containing protein n=1 Tax=Glacieibacterium sp. TaxID=2860237 RepID=UPI003B002E1C
MAAASPCIQHCAIDPSSGWCLGCARTIDEIIAWPNASEAERLAILDKLPQRAAARPEGIRVVEA